jgi:hypothetical protein
VSGPEGRCASRSVPCPPQSAARVSAATRVAVRHGWRAAIVNPLGGARRREGRRNLVGSASQGKPVTLRGWEPPTAITRRGHLLLRHVHNQVSAWIHCEGSVEVSSTRRTGASDLGGWCWLHHRSTSQRHLFSVIVLPSGAAHRHLPRCLHGRRRRLLLTAVGGYRRYRSMWETVWLARSATQKPSAAAVTPLGSSPTLMVATTRPLAGLR